MVEDHGKQRDIGSWSKLIGLEVLLDCCSRIRLFLPLRQFGILGEFSQSIAKGGQEKIFPDIEEDYLRTVLDLNLN